MYTRSKKSATPLSAATHVEVAAPPYIFWQTKYVPPRYMGLTSKSRRLKPHVYKGFDLYMLDTHTTNGDNVT